MRGKKARFLGNMLMVLGSMMMVIGGTYTVLVQVVVLVLPEAFTHAAVMAIIVGGLVWLAGARVEGKMPVSERYWLIRQSYVNYQRRHL